MGRSHLVEDQNTSLIGSSYPFQIRKKLCSGPSAILERFSHRVLLPFSSIFGVSALKLEFFMVVPFVNLAGVGKLGCLVL